MNQLVERYEAPNGHNRDAWWEIKKAVAGGKRVVSMVLDSQGAIIVVYEIEEELSSNYSSEQLKAAIELPKHVGGAPLFDVVKVNEELGEKIIKVIAPMRIEPGSIIHFFDGKITHVDSKPLKPEPKVGDKIRFKNPEETTFVTGVVTKVPSETNPFFVTRGDDGAGYLVDTWEEIIPEQHQADKSGPKIGDKVKLTRSLMKGYTGTIVGIDENNNNKWPYKVRFEESGTLPMVQNVFSGRDFEVIK